MSNVRSLEEQMFRARIRALLEIALNALPDEYRTVLVLRELEEMSTAETAEVLGVTEEVVKTRLHRARAMVQADLCSRVSSAIPDAFELPLSRCDRVVNAVLARIRILVSSSQLVH